MDRASSLLQCPETGQPLKIDMQKGAALTPDGKTVYPFIDGILNLCFEDKKAYIAKSYDVLAPSYDKLLTDANVFTRLYNKVAWGMSDSDYVNKVISLFPRSDHR